jgi:hypothetical protein
MSFTNPVLTEFLIPPTQEAVERIEGFYNAIGWNVYNSPDSEFLKLVSPELGETIPPTILYWPKESERKIGGLAINESALPSIYAKGLRYPELQDQSQQWLIVPSDESVHTIFERGGKLLEAHAHIPPREHRGRQEFRFSDPFNNELRITSHPGWRITATGPSVILTERPGKQA